MTTLAILKSELLDYGTKPNLITVLPRFIRMAEARIARRVRVQEMQKEIVMNVPTSGAVDLPTGFLGYRSVSFTDNSSSLRVRKLDFMPPDQFDEYHDNVQYINDTTRRTFFTFSGNQILFRPEPGDGEEFEVRFRYYERFPALQNDSDTNFVLTNHYDIYLYAALAELWFYVDDTEEEAKCEARFNQRVEELAKIEKRKIRSGPFKRTPDYAV
jgi:hypothetical protein